MVQVIVLLLVLALVVFPAWAIFKIIGLGKQNEALAWKLEELERELRAARERFDSRGTTPAAQPPAASASAPAAASSGPAPGRPTLAEPPVADITVPPFAGAIHLEPAEPPRSAPATPLAASVPPKLESPVPLPLPAARAEATAPAPPIQRRPTPTEVPPVGSSGVDWEQFMGAKLFAWLGGAAAFLGAVFFVKYSFEHDLIPPEVRVALGFLFGLALIIGGLFINRVRYAITVQTLCATGIVVLYAVTFACNSIYHFAFFGWLPTFLLMILITVTAFALAVRLDAMVVAILGMVGGFLTPVLLSTGRDNPAGLFGYIALLDAGLIALAVHRRWQVLAGLGAAGTIIMQVAWAARFFEPHKAPTAIVVCLAFCALFLAAYGIARRWDIEAEVAVENENAPPVAVETDAAEARPFPFLLASAIAFPFVAFGFAAAFVGYASVASRPALLFTFVLLADACLLTLAWVERRVPKLHLAAGIAVFALLAAWTGERMTSELLPWALAFYLLYAVLHSAFPLVLERHRPAAAPTWWSQIFPPLALLLMLGPLFKIDPVPLALWPCILLVDLLAIGLAVITASLTAVAVVLLLTLGTTALWIFRIPATSVTADGMLLVIGGFAVLFFVAGLLLARRIGESSSKAQVLGGPRGQIPAFSVLLPFVLLILMAQRLAVANPSSIFGLALLLVILTLGLTVILCRRPAAGEQVATGDRADSVEWLPACALAGVGALEYAWHARHFSPAVAGVAVGWYGAFTAVFALHPFAFRRRFSALIGPWAVAAAAAIVHFPLVYRAVGRAWPNDFMGVLPALFAVVPLASLVAVRLGPTVEPRVRLAQLAWFGGVALFFITLIFPIQFERQWITIGWALEGAALLWLFQRVPHPGVRATGAVLLVAAFVRLTLNPAVLRYHARSDTPLLNWYLYSYGLVTICLFVGARLLRSPDRTGVNDTRVAGLSATGALNSLAVILAFLLLNLEIADYFSAPGQRVLTFQFSGNFARDMTYTIAWALFALTLLLASIWKRLPAGRYAALALLGVALLKLFLHDLARLEALYRIGALFAVAVIAIVASVAYQRFLPAREKE